MGDMSDESGLDVIKTKHDANRYELEQSSRYLHADQVFDEGLRKNVKSSE